METKKIRAIHGETDGVSAIVMTKIIINYRKEISELWKNWNRKFKREATNNLPAVTILLDNRVKLDNNPNSPLSSTFCENVEKAEAWFGSGPQWMGSVAYATLHPLIYSNLSNFYHCIASLDCCFDSESDFQLFYF